MYWIWSCSWHIKPQVPDPSLCSVIQMLQESSFIKTTDTAMFENIFLLLEKCMTFYCYSNISWSLDLMSASESDDAFRYKNNQVCFWQIKSIITATFWSKWLNISVMSMTVSLYFRMETSVNRCDGDTSLFGDFMQYRQDNLSSITDSLCLHQSFGWRLIKCKFSQPSHPLI